MKCDQLLPLNVYRHGLSIFLIAITVTSEEYTSYKKGLLNYAYHSERRIREQ